MVRLFWPALNPFVKAGIRIVIVSGVLALPRTQLTMPPLPVVRVRDWPVPPRFASRGSARVIEPAAALMKSALIWIVLPAVPTGVFTCSSSGRPDGVSQPSPEIGSSGVSSWSVCPGHTSQAEVAVSRFGS